MRLRYRIWEATNSNKEYNSIQSYLRSTSMHMVYFDKEYVVASQGKMLVAIPYGMALWHKQYTGAVDEDEYQQLVGRGVSVDVAQEMYKSNFTVSTNGMLFTDTGRVLPFITESFVYPEWQKVIPNVEEFHDNFEAMVNIEQLHRVCKAIGCESPVLKINVNGSRIIIKDLQNKDIIAFVCGMPYTEE